MALLSLANVLFMSDVSLTLSYTLLTVLQRVEDALVVLENAISLSPGVFVLYFTHGNVLAV